MQDPSAATQSIIASCIELMNQLPKKTTMAQVQARLVTFFDTLVKEAWTNMKVVLKSTLEPQSEAEESKEEADFANTIAKECNNFMESLQNFELAHEENIQFYLAMKQSHQEQIEQLKERKSNKGLSTPILQAIENFGSEISRLEKELTENRNLASNITLQIKAIFAKERGKFEAPRESDTKMLHLNVSQMKLRTVTVQT